ncbi:hypothetical protein V4V60_003584 [Vibrio mimicus]
MQSIIHNPSQLKQFEPHFRGVTDAVESESIPEVACCRTLVQRSYSTHSVLIPKNPVLIADADAQGVWVSAMVFVPNMALPQTAHERTWLQYQHQVSTQLQDQFGLTLDDILSLNQLKTSFEQHESAADLVAWLGQKYDLDKLAAQV